MSQDMPTTPNPDGAEAAPEVEPIPVPEGETEIIETD